MTEKELLEKIKSSAEKVEIPESLTPDAIKKKLDAAVAAGELCQEACEEEKETENQIYADSAKTKNSSNRKRHWYAGRKVVAAATVILVCGTGVMAAYQMMGGGTASSTSEEASMETAAGASNEAMEENAMAERVPKSDAGEMYVVAENYEDVYELLKSQEESVWDSWLRGEIADGVVLESAPAEDLATGGTSYNSSSTVTMEESKQESEAGSGDKNYSKTNLQTAGVDESDIIKTDGDYIYIVDNDVVKIIDIRSREMEEASEIQVPLSGAGDCVEEMYVDGDVLNLIVECQKTTLQEENERASYDVYYMNTEVETKLLTYDIGSRVKPVLKGSSVQDNSCHTGAGIQ